MLSELAIPQFFILNSTRVDGDITTTTRFKFPASYTCRLTHVPLDVLLLNVRKPFPYLVARVEEASRVYFADGLRAYRDVRGSYFTYKAVTFFAFIESTKTTQVFREVHHASNGHELRRGQEILDAFDPSNHLFRIERINQLLKQKKVDDANALLKLSIELVLESRDCDAMAQLADFVYADHEGIVPDWPLAKKLYEKALTINPNFDLAKGNLGEMLRKTKNGVQAKALFEELLARDRYSYFGLIGLAQLYDHGTPDVAADKVQAEQYYLRTEQTYPTHGYSLGCLAEFYRGKGELKKAEGYFLRAIRADPRDEFNYSGLASTYHMLKEFEKAREYVQYAFLLNTTDELALEVQLALTKIKE